MPKGYCELCGRYLQLQEHHVFPGPLRSVSEKYKLKAYICMECHTVGRLAVHNCGAMANVLKAEYQKTAMEIYGWNMREWCKHFEKNYIEPEEEPEPEGVESGFFQLLEDKELLI